MKKLAFILSLLLFACNENPVAVVETPALGDTVTVIYRFTAIKPFRIAYLNPNGDGLKSEFIAREEGDIVGGLSEIERIVDMPGNFENLVMEIENFQAAGHLGLKLIIRTKEFQFYYEFVEIEGEVRDQLRRVIPVPLPADI